MADGLVSPVDPHDTFRFHGVNPRGEAVFGRFVTSDLPAHTEMRYRQGWRSLIVCSGDGPVPPPFADQGKVAAIEPHPETGKRTWWAEARGVLYDRLTP